MSSSRKTLVHVLGNVYVHSKTSDGGDLYLTRFARSFHAHLAIENWHEKQWFNQHKIRLQGTSAVYKVPTRRVDGESIDLVVKNCRVGENVPLDTHTLMEFCDAEFNSPWEEFALNEELREGKYGPRDIRIDIQRPMAIYVPPHRMQVWQSGRSRSKINRIKAKHPGIDLDILKQYKLIYRWIKGLSIVELFQKMGVDKALFKYHAGKMNGKVFDDMKKKGFLVADMKPEHIIIGEKEVKTLGDNGDSSKQIQRMYRLIDERKYSVVDYELLLRTPEHEEEVKSLRRHSYLDDQRDRFVPTPLPDHLSGMKIFDVPYVYGHVESTGGRLWVVGKNARLFDFFLPERWRKTPTIQLSETKETFYTITKDNIHLVWKTSRVGETITGEDEERYAGLLRNGINSPFEQFAMALELNRLGIPTVYVRAIYMTGSKKIERSVDGRKYDSHKNIRDPEGRRVLQRRYNYITIRGYYNGPDEWVAEHETGLFTPIDLTRAPDMGFFNESRCESLLGAVQEKLKNAGYDGSLLRKNDLLLAMDNKGNLMKNSEGDPEMIICNFELIWKV
jgi:hypothetical protein